MKSESEKQSKTKNDRYVKPESVKMLERELYKFERSLHPTIPEYAIPHPKRRDDTANGLTQCVCDWIRLRGGQAERINTMGRPLMIRDSKGNVIGTKWITSTTTRGSADISAIIRGLSVKIEVKIGRDRQSQDQKDYQRAVEQAGGIYYVAKDFTSFFEWYLSTFSRSESIPQPTEMQA